MIRYLAGSLWICIAMAVSTYVAASWKAGAEYGAAEEGYVGLDYQKTRAISVPMIAEGAVTGYIVAQFVFTADARTLKSLPVPPEVFVVDEAFRIIYSDETLDFENLEKYDLDGLTTRIREATNMRFEADVVKDVLLEELNYLSKDEIGQ